MRARQATAPLRAAVHVAALVSSLRRHSGGKPTTGFRTATKFTLSPNDVNETNVPSAKDVSRMLPSVQELNTQLPNARQLERTYIKEENVRDTRRDAEEEEKEELFVKTTDPLEDLLDGKKSIDAPPPDANHVLLAYRALAWGTVYAVIGFVVVVAFSMWACGYHSVAELLQGVRDKVKRDEAKLRAKAEQVSGASGEEVVHYTIDLANPTEAFEQMRAIWQSVQEMAERESTTKPK